MLRSSMLVVDTHFYSFATQNCNTDRVEPSLYLLPTPRGCHVTKALIVVERKARGYHQH